ncbi:MAG: hypothetical protein L6R41_005751 [Letrouitia leprolyta]|nr:MAG: hypothetical protein L6R41_005751 [Letrouitia leprolyta]
MEFVLNLQNGLDENKPSLFELLSEQQLAALIPPSIRYLLAVATHRRPRYLLRVLNSFDELYALLMLAVERYYLRIYGGSFTENFYGLKRERAIRIKGGEAPRASRGAPALMRETLRLKDKDIWKNLAIMVGLPYIKRKLDESYDIHAPQASIVGPRYSQDTLPPNPTIRQRVMYYYKWFLRNIYPSVNAAYYFFLLAFNLAYLFDNTKYFSPFLWLIGTRIRRMGEADYSAIALAEQTPSHPPSKAANRPGQTNSIWNPTTFTSTADKYSLPVLASPTTAISGNQVLTVARIPSRAFQTLAANLVNLRPPNPHGPSANTTDLLPLPHLPKPHTDTHICANGLRLLLHLHL